MQAAGGALSQPEQAHDRPATEHRRPGDLLLHASFAPELFFPASEELQMILVFGFLLVD